MDERTEYEKYEARRLINEYVNRPEFEQKCDTEDYDRGRELIEDYYEKKLANKKRLKEENNG
jgi:hypothetical protein